MPFVAQSGFHWLKKYSRGQELHELKKDFHVANQKLVNAKKNYWNKLLLGSNNKTFNESEVLDSDSHSPNLAGFYWLKKYSNRAENDTER